jgi:hypothetical protein
VLWGLFRLGDVCLAAGFRKLHIPDQDWYRDYFHALIELLRKGKIHTGRGRAAADPRCAPPHGLLDRTVEPGKWYLRPKVT